MKVSMSTLKAHKPCSTSWKKLRTAVSGNVVELSFILDLLGVHDAIWALRAVEGKEKEIRLFAADCAQTTLPLYEEKFPEDDRPRLAVQAARDYANGKLDINDLREVWADARVAALNAYTDYAWIIASSASRASHCANPDYTAADAAFYASAGFAGWECRAELTCLFKQYFCK